MTTTMQPATRRSAEPTTTTEPQRREARGDWRPPEELRGSLREMARRWSLDRPHLRDDLEQEALLTIWMKGLTDAPTSHQLRAAKHRMISVRKLGRSVDGKPHATYQRRRTYEVCSIEADTIDVGNGRRPVADLLASPFRVERHVVEKLTLLDLLSVLDPDEVRCVTLRCEGYSVRELAGEVRLTMRDVKRLLVAAQRKLEPLLLDAVRTAPAEARAA